MLDPIKPVRNLYRGINAHLQSYYQTEGNWHGFHTKHIGDMIAGLMPGLLAQGYTAGIEESLQLRWEGDKIWRPRADIAIFRPGPARMDQEQQGGVATAVVADVVLTADLPEVLPPQPDYAPFRAAVIYEWEAQVSRRGEPVAWIELLSPANKPGGSHALQYQQKRYELLQQGLVFVEVDYLHESSPTFETLPDYRTRPDKPGDAKARAYRIIVVDPRPQYVQGKVTVYQFDVDASVPTVTIPLKGEDRINFNFGEPYNKTFTELLLGLQHVDYSQLPAQFAHYSYADRRRILNRTIGIIEAAQRQADLETSAIQPSKYALEDALGHFQTLVA
jgi:hypothetical protein